MMLKKIEIILILLKSIGTTIKKLKRDRLYEIEIENGDLKVS